VEILSFNQFNESSSIFEAINPLVSTAQAALKAKGYSALLGTSGPNNDGVDGQIGPNTTAAIKKFQLDNGLKADGILGPNTAAKLGVQPLVGTSTAGTAPIQYTGPQRATPTTGVTPTPTKTAQKATEQPKTKETEKEVAKKKVGTEEVINPNASLIFNGEELQWVVDGKTVKSWKAISGLTWKNTPISDWGKLLNRYITSPEQWSKDANAGPIPPGNYEIGQIETRNGDKTEIGSLEALWDILTGKTSNVSDANKRFQADSEYSKIGWGNFRAPITSKAGTDTHGRGSFYVHGGSLAGSHGCIDLTDQMPDFAKFYGTWLASTKKKSIGLLVNYKQPSANSIFTKLWGSTPSKYSTFKAENPNILDAGKI
jgi:peptidoglycan hydrolase-like protein with peptidoglycan-binding domain